jgi:AsmA protein
MKKFIKILGIIIGSLIGLLVIGGIVLAHLIDPNSLKPQIIKQVKTHTNRTLKLSGDIHWSLFPTIGIEIKDAELGQTRPFISLTKKPFVKIGKAKVNLKLLPLLRGKIQAKELLIHDFKLYLMKTKSGLTNWEMDKKPTVTESLDISQPEKPKKQRITDFSFSKIHVKNAMVDFQSQAPKHHFQIQSIHAIIHDVSEKQFFPIKVSLTLRDHESQFEGKFDLSSQARYQFNKQQLQLKQLQLASQVKGLKFTQQHLQTLLTHPSTLTLSPDEIDIPKLDVAINKQGHITGQIHWDNLKTFKGKLALKIHQLKLNGSTMNGEINQDSAIKKPGQLSLQIDQLNTHRWTPAIPPSSKQKITLSDPIITFFKSLNLRGPITLERIQAGQFKSTNLQAMCHVKDGTMTFSPLTANFYRGKLSSTINLHLNRPMPSLRFRGNLFNVNVQALLADLKKVNRFTGTSTTHFTLNANGLDAHSITRSLNGHLSCSVKNGILKGINLLHYVRMGQALLNKTLPPLPQGPNQTDFGEITGTANIRHGIMTNQDLKIESDTITAKGRGTINLVEKILNYQLIASPTKNRKLVVPLNIGGTFSKINISIDKSELFKQLITQPLKPGPLDLREKIKETFNVIMPH